MTSRRPLSSDGPRATATLLLPWVAVLPIVAGALVDLPRLVRVGDWTALGILAVGELLLAGAVSVVTAAYLWRRTRALWPIYALLGWLAMGMRWWPSAPDALPNALAYALLATVAHVAAVASVRDVPRMARALTAAVWTADATGLSIAAYSVARYGLSVNAWPVHPRAFALVALVPICWHLARGATTSRPDLLVAAAWIAAIVASLSRMAAGAAVIVSVLALVLGGAARRRGRFAFPAPVAVLVGATLLGAALFAPFRQRLGKAEDRTPIWRAVAASAREAPLVGKGPGSSEVEDVLRYWWTRPPRSVGHPGRLYDYAEYWAVHPHDDYLRVWHDLGLPGITLFVAALGVWLRTLHAAFRRDAPAAAAGYAGQLELAGLLMLVAVMIGMTTDNPLVYPFVIAPAATLVGAGLGAAAAARAPAG